MTSRKKKGPIERVVDAITEFIGQPYSDESFEVLKQKKKRAPAKRRAATKKRKTAKARKSKKR